MSLWGAFLSVLFPLRCTACGLSGTPLCRGCLDQVPKMPETNNPLITALYSYRHPSIKKTLWALKYRNNTTTAEIFGNALYEHLLERAHEFTAFSSASQNDKPTVIPIPLHKRRLRTRGFNQSEKIVAALKLLDTNESFLYADDILVKIKETAPQASLKNKQERSQNIRGCFTVRNAEKIKNKVVIVVDDITTTGATLNEALGALKNAGASAVYGIAIAH